MKDIYKKSLKRGVSVALLSVLLTAATQPIQAQEASSQAKGKNAKVIYADELEKLGISTVQEALNLVKNVSDKQKAAKAGQATAEVVYKGVELTGEQQLKVNEALKGLSLEDLDRIEITPDGEKIKYHLSKSLTKDGVKALFSFTVVDLSEVPSKLDPEVITATKTPVKTSELGDVVRVIHADELELMGVTTTEEALGLISNLRFKDSGGIKSISTRGLTTGKTTILFDGINLKDTGDINGAPNFNFIPIAELERIEVISGSKGVFHGSGAIGGVINIITKAGGGNDYLSTKVTTDQQYATFKTSLSNNSSTFYLIGNAAYNHSLSSRSSASRTEKDLFRQNSATFGLANVTLIPGSIDAAFTIIDAGQEDDINSAHERDSFNKASQQLGKLSYTVSPLKRVTSVVDFSFNNLKRFYFDERSDDASGNTTDTDTTYKSRLYDIELRNNINIGPKNSFVLGGGYKKEIAKQTGYYFSNKNRSDDQEEVNIFSQYSWLNPWISGQVGAKVLHYSQEDKKKNAPFYNVSLFRKIPLLDIELKGSWKTGYRLPSLYQRFNSGASAAGNPNLKPEESETREVTLSKSISSLNVSTTYFEIDVDNLVDRHCPHGEDLSYSTPEKSGCFKDVGFYKNVAKTSSKGMEYTLDFIDLGLFEFIRLGYTDVDSKDNKDNPETQFTLATGIRQNKFSFGFFLKKVGKTELGGPAYEYADISAHYHVNQSTRVYTKIHNIGDSNYEIARGYATPGRTFFFGLKKTF